METLCLDCHHSHMNGYKTTDDGGCVNLIFENGGVRYCNCPVKRTEPMTA